MAATRKEILTDSEALDVFVGGEVQNDRGVKHGSKQIINIAGYAN